MLMKDKTFERILARFIDHVQHQKEPVCYGRATNTSVIGFVENEEEIVRLYKYLHKVIKDSYEAERRPYREPREFLVHIAESGKVTLFIDAGDYARVGRRAIYRLERNLFKNFPFLKGKIDSFNMVEDTCAKGKRIKLEDYIRFEIFKMHEGYSYKDCISLDQIKLKEG
ncbi:MAG: hypothetical protein ACOX7N_10740 [Lawsonibacter sp.]|jgi:hypothetical protein